MCIHKRGTITQKQGKYQYIQCYNTKDMQANRGNIQIAKETIRELQLLGATTIQIIYHGREQNVLLQADLQQLNKTYKNNNLILKPQQLTIQ